MLAVLLSTQVRSCPDWCWPAHSASPSMTPKGEATGCTLARSRPFGTQERARCVIDGRSSCGQSLAGRVSRSRTGRYVSAIFEGRKAPGRSPIRSVAQGHQWPWQIVEPCGGRSVNPHVSPGTYGARGGLRRGRESNYARRWACSSPFRYLAARTMRPGSGQRKVAFISGIRFHSVIARTNGLLAGYSLPLS